MSKHPTNTKEDESIDLDNVKDVKVKEGDIESPKPRPKKRQTVWRRWTEAVCIFLRQTAKGVRGEGESK